MTTMVPTLPLERADPAQHGNSETVDHGVHQES